MKTFIAGKYGQVTWEARRSLAVLGDAVALWHTELNLEDSNSIRSRVREVRPAIIVSAGADTAVALAEIEPDNALRVNGVAQKILAEESKWAGAGLVHYSTDYVFEGTMAGSYEENDKPNPVNVDGLSKLAHERDELRIVDDHCGAPTAAGVITDATAQILGIWKNARDWPTGVYNLVCRGTTTWLAFALDILDACGKQLALRRPQLVTIATEEYPPPSTPRTRFCTVPR